MRRYRDFPLSCKSDHFINYQLLTMGNNIAPHADGHPRRRRGHDGIPGENHEQLPLYP